MRQTRDLLKKQQQQPFPPPPRYQRNISCNKGLIKDRNGKDLTEAEEIKKRGQKYMEEST